MTELNVTGMSCEDCERSVEEALAGVEGVESAAADHERDAVVVEGTADSLDLVIAVEDAGYDVEA
jgi:copper chaperone CopZ